MDPIAWLRAELFTFGTLADAMIWLSILLFLTASVLEWRAYKTDGSLQPARYTAVAAFVVFGLFWFNVFPYFAFDHQSYVEGILSLVALPLCLYTAKLLYDGRNSLFILSRAIGVMGLIYVPFETIPAMTIAGIHIPEPRRILIEFVADITAVIITAMGYEYVFTESVEGFDAAFLWTLEDGHRYRVSVILACTGIGSMAIFGGLIAAVKAPLKRKLKAIALSFSIIFVLNIIRMVFITVVTGNQYMHWAPDLILFLFGADNPYRVSFLVSDRIISQFGAVIALMVIAYLVVRELPELLVVLEDLLYLLTGEEHNLEESLNLPRTAVGEDPALRSD